MTHEEINAAVRKSLLMDDARETHHAVYPKRPPIELPAPQSPEPSK